MPSITSEMFSRVSLIASGSAFLFIGALLWRLPRIFSGMFGFRRHYAAKLRASGEEKRAERVEAETAIILRRIPIYGKVFVAIAVAAILASILSHR